MQIRTYKKAIKYLEKFIGKIVFKINKSKKHDPLERMRIFLSLLGNPQYKFKSVLVGGTSGKGSTAYLISHILTTAGYKTGFTVSPHLQKVNERLQIRDKEISDKEFTKMVTMMIRIIVVMKRMKVGVPSYFEILVAMAFKYFADQKVDIAVVEVGMGGEFDATNTLNPLIAVLTNVGLDHTNILGPTVEKIAKTKSGIIKTEDLRSRLDDYKDLKSLIASRRSPIVVSGVTQKTVVKIVEDRCKDVGGKLNLLWRDFGYKIKKEDSMGVDFDFISLEEILHNLKLSLRGAYQAENASIAIRTILELRKLGFKISDQDIKKALKTASFPGRFEIIGAQGPVTRFPPASAPLTVRAVGSPSSHATLRVVLDGAHNPTKMKEFLKSLIKIFPQEKKVFVLGFKFDKDIKKMLGEIIKIADKIIITEFNRATDMNMHASANAFKIKTQISKLKSGMEVIVEKDSKKALKKAIKMKPELIVVTGSLYLAGEIRNKIAPF